MTKSPSSTKNQNTTWQHTHATKNFDYTTIADRLRTVILDNDSHQTGVVKPVNGIPTLSLTRISSTLTLLPNFGGFHRTLQRVRLANRGRLLLRTPGPVPLGNCICSNVETILSWTCHVYGPFESRTSLGTSILLEIEGTNIPILFYS